MSPIFGAFINIKKVILSSFLLFLISLITNAQVLNMDKTAGGNYALHLDGADNNPCIGMDILKGPWTIEAWIKGDDLNWKKTEAIISAGEYYGDLQGIDQIPLEVRDGKLHCPGITSAVRLDDKWHYVALSNDGTTTTLYQDGQLLGISKGARSILPGAIGVCDKPENTFGGCIDEVRIWKKAINETVLRNWADKPISPSHPDFKSLWGYYNFDQLKDDVCLNLVGKGHQAYHLRNMRLNWKEKKPLAYLVVNDNPHFKNNITEQKLFNAVTIESEWDASQGEKNAELLKLRIIINGNNEPLKLTQLKLDLSASTSITDLDQIHIYYTGQSPRDTTRVELFGSKISINKKIALTTPTDAVYILRHGINYFLVSVDIKKDAKPGDIVSAKIPGFSLNGKQYTPESETANIRKTIIPSSGTDFVKVLQWNIWHGGVHMGNNGRNRIKELIRSTDADIICMQEAYGSQELLADSLGFQMITASKDANLALFSRYPITKLPAKESFKSLPALIELPNHRQILVADWWLRYAYRPAYTDHYTNPGYNTDDWIKEDSTLGATDAKVNLNDFASIIEDKNLPVIVSGDFNSGSHLDWTKQAAPLHNGYGPVALPISKLMINSGYVDSYREINPDELSYPGGTFAVIFGQLRTSRIDFIYYNKQHLQAVASKIIRTAPEIDDVWPSDHAAVLTVFRIDK